MTIYSLYKDGVYVCSFQFREGVASYLGVKSPAVRAQFRRKGYYSKGSVRVVRDTLR